MNLLDEAWIPVRLCDLSEESLCLDSAGLGLQKKNDRAVNPPGQLPTDVGNNPH